MNKYNKISYVDKKEKGKEIEKNSKKDKKKKE